MTRREGYYVLPGNPVRYVGVDLAAGADHTTEVECEVLPEGTIVILDVREIPRMER